MISIEELDAVVKRLLEIRDILNGRDDMRLPAYFVEMAVLDISDVIASRRCPKQLPGFA